MARESQVRITYAWFTDSSAVGATLGFAAAFPFASEDATLPATTATAFAAAAGAAFPAAAAAFPAAAAVGAAFPATAAAAWLRLVGAAGDALPGGQPLALLDCALAFRRTCTCDDTSIHDLQRIRLYDYTHINDSRCIRIADHTRK